MRDVAEIVLPWIVSTWAIFAILRRDERTMTSAQRRRSWPDSTRLSAVVAFGAIALPIHFARTRRSAVGVFFGVALAVGVQLLAAALDSLVEFAFDAFG